MPLGKYTRKHIKKHRVKGVRKIVVEQKDGRPSPTKTKVGFGGALKYLAPTSAASGKTIAKSIRDQ